jgi:hypothetical protein
VRVLLYSDFVSCRNKLLQPTSILQKLNARGIGVSSTLLHTRSTFAPLFSEASGEQDFGEGCEK